MTEGGLFGDLDPVLEDMQGELSPVCSTVERVIGYTVADNKKVQISLKINTDEDEWISD